MTELNRLDLMDTSERCDSGFIDNNSIVKKIEPKKNSIQMSDDCDITLSMDGKVVCKVQSITYVKE